MTRKGCLHTTGGPCAGCTLHRQLLDEGWVLRVDGWTDEIYEEAGFAVRVEKTVWSKGVDHGERFLERSYIPRAAVLAARAIRQCNTGGDSKRIPLGLLQRLAAQPELIDVVDAALRLGAPRHLDTIRTIVYGETFEPETPIKDKP